MKFWDRRAEAARKKHLFFIFFEWKNAVIEQSNTIHTTTPWSLGAGLCGVFLMLHRCANQLPGGGSGSLLLLQFVRVQTSRWFSWVTPWFAVGTNDPRNLHKSCTFFLVGSFSFVWDTVDSVGQKFWSQTGNWKFHLYILGLTFCPFPKTLFLL